VQQSLKKITCNQTAYVICTFNSGDVTWIFVSRDGVRSTRGLGPTMTARGQSIGILTAMLPQTLTVSRLDQLSRLGAWIQFFHYS